MAKFKVETSGKGIGAVSLEKGSTGTKDLVLLTFRNNSGNLLFQGQLVRNVSKLIKHTSHKTYKIQRVVTVVGKHEKGDYGIIRCTITVLQEEMMC